MHNKQMTEKNLDVDGYITPFTLKEDMMTIKIRNPTEQ